MRLLGACQCSAQIEKLARIAKRKEPRATASRFCETSLPIDHIEESWREKFLVGAEAGC